MYNILDRKWINTK